MKTSFTKQSLSFLLVLTIMYSLLGTVANAASTTAYDCLSDSKYAKAYPVNTGTIIPYTTTALTQRGTISYGASASSYIDGYNDLLYVMDVGINSNGVAWAKVSYPVGNNKRVIAYIHLSDLTANTHSVKSVASGKFLCALRQNGSLSSSYYVAKSDAVWLLTVAGNRVQILYPAGSMYRIAWAEKGDYEKYCGSIGGIQTTHYKQKSPVIEEGDYYYIASALDPNMVLDVTNGSSKDGTNIQLHKKNATNAQLFRFEKSSTDGYYYIINKGSRKAVDIQGGGTSSGTNVQQYTRNNTQAQRWKLLCVSGADDKVTIQAQCGKYLDVQYAETKNGTNIWIYDGNGTLAQQFILVPYVTRTYKTVTLDFHDFQSWASAVSTAQRSLISGGSLKLNPSGNYYNTGYTIIGIEVLNYKRLTVQVPAEGPGATKFVTIDFPCTIRYILHSHSDDIHCWFNVSDLKFWQTCECGYHDEWTWEVPWPDLTSDSDTQTTSKTIKAIQPVWRNLYNVQ